jgi:hypothetical protein
MRLHFDPGFIVLRERVFSADLVNFSKQNLQFRGIEKARVNGVAFSEILLSLCFGQTIRW